MHELERTKPYIPILDSSEFEIYPAPKGIEGNRFTFVTSNGSHLTVKSIFTGTQYHIPLEMVEFANPGKPAILRLRREMEARGNSFV